ncbi:MAG TPA: TolC family protein [Candidatus Hydrogenedens sp.]|nr:TolC family protein [Candidatus Hydrogenedens sp.]HOK09550.1 TolC family protein [Candidatus Hydrogenedens sp.]HOL19197.1 TolC family protein [Candidatus Hydrogenedens sp.]HPP58413.1 TolC family protein [Candidatus Hydrogenedens sp.]
MKTKDISVRTQQFIRILLFISLLSTPFAFSQDTEKENKDNSQLGVSEEQAKDILTETDSGINANSGRSELNLQKEISVDLIDLDALRKATEERRGPNAVARMSLKECIEIALKQNPDIIVSGLEPRKAQADQLTASGMFDPFWQTSLQYNYASIIANQQIRAYAGINSVETHQTTFESTVAGKIKLGTQYAVTFNNEIEETSFSDFTKEYGGRLLLTLTQPLLKGFGIKVNAVQIEMAKHSEKIGEAQLRMTVMNTVAEIIKAYWDLVGAMENVKVREEALANAERLLSISEKRREIGTAADIEVLQAKAGVATRQSELVTAQAQLESASDILKNFLLLRDGDLFSKTLIVPTDRPHSFENERLNVENLAPDVDQSVEKALKNRPEIVMASLQIDIADLQLLKARNEMLPQVDVIGSYGQGGRDRSLAKMFYGIRDDDETYYTYGIKAVVPLGNRAGRGAYQRARLTKRESEEQKKKIEQTIMMGVHLAVRNVETNRVLVESNRQARKLQEANVIAEEKRLRLGVSTSWRVLQVQTDYTVAKTLELQAQIAYEKALTDLYLAEGTLLEQMGVEVSLPQVEDVISYGESIKPRWE